MESDFKHRILPRRRTAGAAALATLVAGLAAGPAWAWSERVIYSFGDNGSTDAYYPTANLIMDSKGNLYGAGSGGANARGAIFELTPPTKPPFIGTEKLLYSFAANGADGAYPQTGLLMDSAGNLYGTTAGGGANCTPYQGCGTAFKLSPPATQGGTWTETVLYNFGASSTDGNSPQAGLIMDASGNLYGTTNYGGVNCVRSFGCGTVFELSPPAKTGAAWTETVLYNFGASATDGQHPWAALLADANGHLYGTTVNGGAYNVSAGGDGTVFELIPPPTKGGKWKETVLHSFGASRSDASWPYATLVMDPAGNLYGTSWNGGANCASSGGCGAAFELSPPAKAGDRWKETVLHNFGNGVSNGIHPWAGLILDAKGNLYGTTYQGSANGGGMVFELSPPAQAGGHWTETRLHGFPSTSIDGVRSKASLVMNAHGDLFGTTFGGGSYSVGTVFELLP